MPFGAFCTQAPYLRCDGGAVGALFMELPASDVSTRNSVESLLNYVGFTVLYARYKVTIFVVVFGHPCHVVTVLMKSRLFRLCWDESYPTPLYTNVFDFLIVCVYIYAYINLKFH